MINVKDSPFGAIGDGSTDDTEAIKRAINYARSVATAGGGVYRPTIYFPAGYYYISSPIDITNTSGIWLKGDGGKWLNTCIFGHTSGIMFDFSGSDQSGCENFYFLSTNSADNTRSTIGVQFALTNNGGLNCGIRNCTFLMEDYAGVNSGFGSIGVLNIRSEEFYIHECFIRANTPVIMSNSASLDKTGVNFVASSRYQTLAAGTGSMGVTSILATSLQGYEKRQPALVLNGTNSLTFQGYMGRVFPNNGSNETAILCTQYTTNLRIHATIESYSRALQLVSASLEGADLHMVVANSTAPTTELINVTGCTFKGVNLRISLPNVSERNNRYVIYSAPNSNGTLPAISFVKNCEISCFDVISNQYIITADTLRQAFNVVFHTELPFEKRGGRIRLLNNSFSVAAGTAGSVAEATVLQFRQANQTTQNNTYGGYYRVWLDGVVRAGSFGSGAVCTLSFQAQILVNQLFNGNFDQPSITVITLDKSVTNPAYLDILGVLVNITFANGLGVVTVKPRVKGSGNGEPVTYDGTAEIQSNFYIGDPIPVG